MFEPNDAFFSGLIGARTQAASCRSRVLLYSVLDLRGLLQLVAQHTHADLCCMLDSPQHLLCVHSVIEPCRQLTGTFRHLSPVPVAFKEEVNGVISLAGF